MHIHPAEFCLRIGDHLQVIIVTLMQSAIINYSANGVGTWYKAKAKPKGGQPSA